MPQVWLLLLFYSNRVRANFSNNLFNDTVAMTFLYICVYFVISRRWVLASLFYSIALSIKMNIFLFGPGFAIVVLKNNSILKTFLLGMLAIGYQVLISLPFLLTYPDAYIRKAYLFDMQYGFKGTCNWMFLTEEIFLDKRFHKLLLVLTLAGIILFLQKKWLLNEGGVV
jgi:alpha-1,3-mannosyltransferase